MSDAQSTIPDPTKHKFYGRIDGDYPPKFSHPHPRVTICTLTIPVAPRRALLDGPVNTREFVGVAICSEVDVLQKLQDNRIGRRVALNKALDKYGKWVEKRRSDRAAVQKKL